MTGSREDHYSNPLRISVNPVRTDCSAVAGEWIAIKHCTHGAPQLAKIAANHSGKQRWIWNSMANAPS